VNNACQHKDTHYVDTWEDSHWRCDGQLESVASFDGNGYLGERCYSQAHQPLGHPRKVSVTTYRYCHNTEQVTVLQNGTYDEKGRQGVAFACGAESTLLTIRLLDKQAAFTPSFWPSTVPTCSTYHAKIHQLLDCRSDGVV
jgi:hypothetical protein